MMLKKFFFIITFVIVLSSACSDAGAQSLIGRWEIVGDSSLDLAYEFYEDGSGAAIMSQVHVNEFTYSFDEDGKLKITYPELNDRSEQYTVSFQGVDEIIMERSESIEPMHFSLKPIPDLPARARIPLVLIFSDQEYMLLETRKLENSEDVDEVMEEYSTIVYETDVHVVVGEPTEDWLVRLQVPGEEEPRVYILTGTEEKPWGAIRLLK